MATFVCKTLTFFIICMALQEGCGLPLSELAEQPAQSPQPHRVRTKRCSCNSWEDKECIYFCHLDIIWVNTPSKLLPYGLGSPLSRRRRRRSADRCECLNSADKACSGFCQKRSVVKTNTAIAKGILSSNENPGGVNRMRSRTRG